MNTATRNEFAAGSVVIGILVVAIIFIGEFHQTPQRSSGIGATTQAPIPAQGGFAGPPVFSLVSSPSVVLSGNPGQNLSTTIVIQPSTSFNLYISYLGVVNGTSTVPAGTVVYSTVDGTTTTLPAPSPGTQTGPGTGLTPVSSSSSNVNSTVTLAIPATAVASNQYQVLVFVSSYNSNGGETYSQVVKVSLNIA